MKATQKQFKHFKARCEFWADYLGLNSWTIKYFHQEDDGVYATCHADASNSIASITMAKTWPDTVWDGFDMEEFLDSVALHETIHIVLEPLRNSPCVSEAELYARNEGVARMLTKAIKKTRA